MRIVIDGTEQKEFMLNPKEVVKLKAKQSFALLIGNAGGVKLFYNGRYRLYGRRWRGQAHPPSVRATWTLGHFASPDVRRDVCGERPTFHYPLWQSSPV